MNQHTYKKIEVIGCSSKDIESAIRNATTKASMSVRNLQWFEVNQIRGSIAHGDISEWQVEMKLAFTLDEEESIGATIGNALSQKIEAEIPEAEIKMRVRDVPPKTGPKKAG